MAKRKSKLRLQGIFFFIFFAITSFVVTSFFINKDQVPICANTKTCKDELTLKIENDAEGEFAGRKVTPPRIDLTQDSKVSKILGIDAEEGEKHIYVDVSKQTLYAFQGNTQVLKTLISSGKWGRTPVGNFNVWTKLRSTRMAGGSGDDSYNLPNVPYVMYFYSDFGIHGAYWHNNFGHAMSHGCVNMRQVDAKILYEWADAPNGGNLGTAVSICNSIKDNKCVQTNPIN